MKICVGCEQAKPLRDFYRYRSGEKYRRLGVCKECVKSRVRLRRARTPAAREYDRLRAKRPERKKHMRRVVIKWRKTNPDAYKAQTAVGNALRDGKLIKQPCSVCGAVEHVHA